MRKKIPYDRVSKYSDAMEELKVKCTCGHTTVMPVFVDKKICSYCGNIVKNNTKAYFIYKMRKELIKSEK